MIEQEESEEFIPNDLEYVKFEDGDPSRHVFFSPSMQKQYYSYEAQLLRTIEQVKRVGYNLRLNTQRMSILLHVRKDLETQEDLINVANDLRKAENGLVNRILNNIASPPTQFTGVKSSWGAMIPMVGSKS